MTSLTQPSDSAHDPYRASMRADRSRLRSVARSLLRSCTRPCWVWLVLILGVAAGLRLHGLDREGFWGDEYLQVTSYRLPLHHTVWNALSRHGFGPPDFVIGWLAYRISPTVWMCRLPSALWGIASVWLCFLLGRRLVSWQAGLLAAAILTFCRLHLVLSQEVRPYSICLAFMLLTLWALLRSLENPTRVRLLAYASIAVVCTMTRSFIPCVFLAVIGLVLTIAVAWRKWHLGSGETGSEPVSYACLRRVWLTTMGAGLAAMLWIVILFATIPTLPPGVVALVSGNTVHQNVYNLDTALKAQVLRNSAITARALIGSYGPLVLCLAGAGVLLTAMHWRKLGTSTRYVMAIMMLSGPSVILIYSIISGAHLFYERYSFFLLPFVAVFASVSLTAGLRVLATTRRSKNAFGYAAVFVGLWITFAYPARMSAEEAQSYRRIDWRGCAEFLSESIGADDVVLVLTDTPFGRVQQRFFGKYEWPRSGRPLGEAAWTLAISDNHFERLLRQKGKCVAVLVRRVLPQRAGAFQTAGLQSPPSNHRLVKFRGIDVLIPEAPAASIRRQAIELCDALTAIDLLDYSTKAVPLTLKTRLLLSDGRFDEARRTYHDARRYVPPVRLALFDAKTQSWMPHELRSVDKP